MKETPGITLLSKESTDPGRNATSVSMTMMMPSYAVQAALPVGFAEHPYPKISSYLTIDRSLTVSRNPNLGSVIICKLSRYWGHESHRNAKFAVALEWIRKIVAKEATK
jgi:hypothetical protein